MTNREFMESLPNEKLIEFIYKVMQDKGRDYIDTFGGLSKWLNEESPKRCPNCMNQLYDGVCYHCGFRGEIK